MLDEDDLPRKKTDGPLPRKLEGLSQEELTAYIAYLESETERVRDRLNSKSHMLAAAQALFGKKA